MLTWKEVIWVVGLVLGGIEYRSLLTLGTICLMAFPHSSQTRKRWSSWEKILSVHVMLILVGNTFLQVWNVKIVIQAIFYTDPDRVTFFYRGWQNITIAFLAILTQGVLVWRCYMIHEALSTGLFVSPWHHLCWIFPVLLWIIGAATGLLAVGLLDPTAPLFDEAELHSPGLTFFLVALTINLILNTFCALSIIIRLLLHRRYVVTAFGRRNGSAQYALRTPNILLESAVINIPLAVLSIIGLSIQAEYAMLLTQIITPGQCITSILIVYQVVRRNFPEHMICNNNNEPASHIGFI